MNKKEFLLIAAVAAMGCGGFAHGAHHGYSGDDAHSNCTGNRCQSSDANCPVIDHSHCTGDFCVATGGVNTSCPQCDDSHKRSPRNQNPGGRHHR